MEGLVIQPTGIKSCQVGHIGKVADVLKGEIPPDLSTTTFSTTQYRCGFVVGSPKNKDSIGEAIIVNGNCYTTSTEKNSADYNKIIYGPKFITNCVFLIPKTTLPSHKLTFTASSKGVSLLDLYKEVYQKINHPLAFAGIIEFADFHAVGIGKSPIDGTGIFEHKNEYYPFPEIRQQHAVAFVVGVITDYQQTTYHDVNQQLEKVLYNNPFETSSNLTHHAHALTLSKLVAENEITPQITMQALHLLADKTVITKANLDIFTINGLDDFQKPEGTI